MPGDSCRFHVTNNSPKTQLLILEPFFDLRIPLRVFIGLELLVLWIWKMRKTQKRKGGRWTEGG